MSKEIFSDTMLTDENAFEEDNTPPATKLERRRRIEQMAEEKKLREELADFDF